MSGIIVNPYTSSGVPASIAFIGTTDQAPNNATHTYNTVAIGAADATRRVVVAVHFADSTTAMTLNSATIGGIAATINVPTTSPGAQLCRVAIISALVPTGTTATIVLSFSGACDFSRIAVYRAINETVATPHATATDTTISSGVLSTTIDIPSNGWVVACAEESNTTGISWTMVGAGEQYDSAITGAAGIGTCGGFTSGLGVETGRTISATTNPTTPANGALAAMSWG